MRRLLSVCAFIALGTPLISTAARADVAYTQRDAFVCIDPRAVRALGNGADPRQANPDWILSVTRRGQCGTLPGGTPVTRVGDDGDLSRIVASSGQLFIARADLADAPPARPADATAQSSAPAFPPALQVPAPPAPNYANPAPATPLSSPGPLAASVPGGLPASIPAPQAPAAPPAAPWHFSASSEGLYTCQAASATAQGQVALTAAAARPKVARLLLQRPAWAIPPGTLVHANLTFGAAPPLKLVGIGDGTDIAVDLTEVTLPPLMDGLTTASSATVSFTSVTNEPAWPLDLRGVAAATAAMAACVRDHHIDVPPPLGEAQPAEITAAPAPRGAAKYGWAAPTTDRQASDRQANSGDKQAWVRPARRPAPTAQPPSQPPPGPPPPQPLAATAAPQPPPTPPEQPEGTRAYVGCLRSEARTGQYTTGSADHNALTVLSQCIPEWRKWMDECRKTNAGTGRDCTIDSIALAKIGLYASGKRTD